MDFQLVVIRGRSATTAVKLAEGVTTAGRQEDCQLRIKSSQVSRKHCQLFEKSGMLLVKDLGSSNGTIVNGTKIEAQQVLEPGDELGIGPIVFRVEKIGQPAPSKPAAAPKAKTASDTAIVEGITEASPDDDFEIDFDDEPAPATAAESADDFEFEVEDEKPAASAPVAVAPPSAAPTPAPVKKPAASLADSKKPAPPKPEPEPVPRNEEPTVADDAVADFLSSLKLDDED